ncbi:MAG: inositol monophosphatase [Phycisphaerae bacterium]|nr:inositol monophosphatase [Phycisphaerae bacterium]
MNEFLTIAERVVREAGLKAKQMISSSRICKHKPYGDIVTEADLFVEEYVISSLKKVFPGHGFDSEERGQENVEAEYVWILDPIDGTKHYVRNVPLYSVSLALERHKEPVLGVVYSPESDRMYCASTGGGATLNGGKIHCSKPESLKKALICLEIPSRFSTRDEQRWAIEKMSVLVEHVYRVRIIGVGSLGLCLCAAGGFDAYVNLGNTWKYCDIAAGQVIVREAGGEISHIGGQIVAGPATLCNKIRAILEI